MNCQICKKLLDQGDARSVDCGGDCAECMAKFGDLDCRRSIAKEDYLKTTNAHANTQPYLAAAFDAGWDAAQIAVY